MTGFFIKKAFFDGWDNLLTILAVNALLMGLAFGGFFLAGLTVAFLPVSLASLLVSGLLIGVLLTAFSSMMARVASYKSYSLKDLVAAVRETWTHGLLFALSVTLAGLVFSVTVPYYLELGGPVGYVLAMVMFWAAVVTTLSLQWFLPIRSQLGGSFVKCLKKSFIIFFDNPGFSLFMMLYSAVLLVLSLPTMTLLPGIGGLVLAYNEAFRLRLYKYDWIEKHPELDFRIARKSVPWDELLTGDVETFGDRSLRNLIFPWKD